MICLSVLYLYFFLFFECYGQHRDLHVLPHSFPTRRSSDLSSFASDDSARAVRCDLPACGRVSFASGLARLQIAMYRGCRRSEEHTSELQSLMRISYAVFCLKKKKSL